jgi:hypothetical protein
MRCAIFLFPVRTLGPIYEPKTGILKNFIPFPTSTYRFQCDKNVPKTVRPLGISSLYRRTVVRSTGFQPVKIMNESASGGRFAYNGPLRRQEVDIWQNA